MFDWGEGEGFVTHQQEELDAEPRHEVQFLTIHPDVYALKARAASQTEVQLFWKNGWDIDPGTLEIDQALGDGAFSNIASVASSTTSFLVTGLTAGTRYRFQVSC